MHFHLIKRIVSFIKRLLVAFLICDVTLTTLQAIPIRQLQISHNAPHLPPKTLHNLCFSFLLGIYSCSKRNWKQCLYKILEGKYGSLWEMCKWRIEWRVYRVSKWNACFNLCSKAQNKCKVTWDQAPHCGEKAKKIGEQSKPRGNLGRGKGGGAWRHAFDAADPPCSN